MQNSTTEYSKKSIDMLKFMAVGLLTCASSLSLPIVINTFVNKNSKTIENNILILLLPYLGILPFRAWLLWNFIGQRIEGSPELEIQNPDNTFQDTSAHILLAFIANIPSFTNAFTSGYAVFFKSPLPVKLAISLTLGSLNYFSNIYTEVLPAFRKHAEIKRNQGQKILPFFNQKYTYFLAKYALTLSQTIREVLPIIRGIVWAKTTNSVLDDYLSNYRPEQAIMLMRMSIALLVYCSAAYSSRFEILQLRDNLAINNQVLAIEPYLCRLSNPFISTLAQASSGALLLDILKKLKFTHKSAINFLLLFTALGMSALIQEIFHSYVSNPKQNEAYSEANTLILNQFVSPAKASQISQEIEPVFVAISILLGFISSYAKRASLLQYEKNNHEQIHPIQETPSQTLNV